MAEPAPAPIEPPAAGAVGAPTQRLYDAKTGAAIDVPAADVAAHLAAGTAGFAEGQEVVLAGEGGLRKVSGAQAVRELKYGRGVGLGSDEDWAEHERVAAEAQEYGGLRGAAEATAAGVARGLSFGASDWIARKIGIGDELANAKRHHEGLSVAGELAGAVLPAAFSGGATAAESGAALAARGASIARAGEEAGVVARGLGAIGKATEAVGSAGEAVGRFLPELVAAEAGATAKVLGGVGRGAAEGALYGAGQAVSDASLKAEPITLDKLLAGGGMGALMGGGLSGGLAGLGVVVGGGVKAAGRAADWAAKEEGAIAKLLGREVKPMLDELATNKAISSLGPTQRMVEDLRALGPDIEKRVASRVLDEIPELAGKRSLAQMRRQEIGAVVESERSSIGKAIGAEYRALDDAVAKTGVGTPQVGDVMTKVWSDVIEPLAQRPGYESAAKQVLKSLRTFENSSAINGWSFEAIHKLSGDLGRTARKLGRGNPVVGEAYGAAYKAIRQELERAGDGAAKAAGLASFSAKIKPLNARYADYSWMADAVKRGTAADIKNRTFGLSEALGAIRGQSVGSAVGGAVGSVLGPLGQGAGALLGGAAGSFGNAMMQHVVRTYGDQAAAVLARRAVQSDALRAVTQTVDEMVDRRVRAALGRGAIVAREGSLKGAVVSGASRAKADDPKRDLGDRYAQAAKAAAQFSASRSTSQAATDRIRGAHPELAVQLDAKAKAVGENIRKRLPKPTMAGKVLPMSGAKAIPPSDESKSSFLRYYSAAVDPLSALDHLADGKLAKEHVDALKENYPDLLQEARGRVLESIANGAGKKMTHERRFQVGMFLEAPTDVMLLPEMMAATRGVYDQLAQGGAQQGAPPGGPATSKTSFALQGAASEDAMTHAERVERG